MSKHATPSGTDAAEAFLDGLARPRLEKVRALRKATLRQWIGHVPAQTP